jgi:LEA14-like dessication related protein
MPERFFAPERRWTLMVTRSLLTKVAVVGVLLVVVVGGSVGYVGYTYSQNPPSVESVNSEWGEVTEERTELETTVVVDNPNSVGIPGVVGVRYTTRLNDVVLIQGENPSVGIDSGRNEIVVPGSMENEAIAEWWVSHVNNGESSEMTVSGELIAPGGVNRTISSQSSTFETNMLASLQGDGPQTVSLQGEQFIVLRNQSASWGEADMETTPMSFSATVENKHDYDLTLDGVGYEIRMNDVTVGEGRTSDGLTVRPGETGTLEIDAAIDTPKMAQWWATHVENNESTRMSIAMYGLVERDGELKRVPFELVEQDLQFTTNLLEGGGTSVQPVQDESAGPSYEQPSVTDSTREWGDVTDEYTQIQSTVTVDNPNNGSINDFVVVRSGQRVTINDVVVADGTSDLGTMDQGTNRLQATTRMDNTKVPEWWARHVNNGEQSSFVAQPQTVADLGFTKFGVGISGTQSTMETDMLAGLDSTQTQPVRTESGLKVAEVEEVQAEWGQADTQTSPITVEATITNTFDTRITLRDLQYTVLMNDVTAGDGTDEVEYVIEPGETRTLTFELALDSQQMQAWWVSHIRNDEVTAVDVSASVEVDTPIADPQRVDLDALSDSQNVTTDFLGNGE